MTTAAAGVAGPAHAPYVKRVLAHLVDLVLVVPGAALFVLGRHLNSDHPTASWGPLLVILGVALFLLAVVGNDIVRQSRQGATIGKEALGIRLVDERTGTHLAPRQVFLRFLVGPGIVGIVAVRFSAIAAAIFGALLVIDFLWPLWDRKKQTWGDKFVASTVLLAPPAPPAPPAPAAPPAPPEAGRAVAASSPSSTRSAYLLEVEGLCVNYGHIEAIRDISFTVEEGSVATLIGANGAGKTTTLKTISGLRRVRAGRILFDGKDITHLPPFERVLMGLSQSPEGRGCFPGMTVLENLDMGAFVRRDRKTAAYQTDLDRVFDLFPRLKEREKQFAGSMSGGEQQMLAIGRALMAKPRLVLLDEPSMGLAPKLIQQIFSIITEINTQGTTVLLVEQNAAQALKRAHTAHILETGEIVRSGTGAELAGDDSVKAAYLGGDV